MKTVLLDGTLILQGLTDEGDFHQQFVVLWKALQSPTLQGYITKLDLANLHQRLNDEIGAEASERLLTAFERILKPWMGDRPTLFNAIITENPQQFEEWDVPILSVAEFLTRYELDSLLHQSSEASLSLTETDASSDHKTNKIGTLALLMLPILLELWMRREHLTAVLAVVNRQAQEPLGEPIQPSMIADSTEAIALRQSLPVVNSSTAPSARLLWANLPSIDVSVENDIPLDVQLDSQADAVMVQLLIPQVAQAEEEQIAATIRRTDTGEAIAQIFTTSNGVFIVANPSEGEAQTLSEASDSQLITTVQQTAEGQLTARLNIHGATSGDRAHLSASNESGQEAIVSVRSVDSYSVNTLAPEQSAEVEIRVEVNPDGTREVVVGPMLGNPTPQLQPRQATGDTGVSPDGGQPFIDKPQIIEDYDNSWVLNNNPPPVSPPPSNPDQFADGSTNAGYEFVDSSDAPVIVTIDFVELTSTVFAVELSTPNDTLQSAQESMILIDSTDELLAGGTFASGTFASDTLPSNTLPSDTLPSDTLPMEVAPSETPIQARTNPLMRQSLNRHMVSEVQLDNTLSNLGMGESTIPTLPHYSDSSTVEWLPPTSISRT